MKQKEFKTAERWERLKIAKREFIIWLQEPHGDEVFLRRLEAENNVVLAKREWDEKPY